ncbi:MAG: 1,6-anhydro-N-acetylmuramyl-L-alanine amidase AmpD [Candidatus Bathyarchaeia archaeon]
MELEITRIKSPHFEKGRSEPPDTIVIHSISLPPGEFGTGRVIDFFTGRLNPDLHPYFKEIYELKVSSHFFIERDGSIYQFVDTDDTAWHAGESSFSGRKDCNRFSIGIELEGDLEHEFTDAQYRNLLLLCRDLMSRYPSITPERIVGHSDVAPKRKEDPGPFFDWKGFRKRLSSPMKGARGKAIFMERGFKGFRLERVKIEELIDTMTLEEKVAQLIVAGFDGKEPPEEMRYLIQQMGLGGVILFGKNCPDPLTVHLLCKSIHDMAMSSRNAIPIMICLDQEGGRVVRIREGVTLFPGNEILGRLGSSRRVERVARITAMELRSLGIQMNLSPVADVAEGSNPNPVISGRSFGKDPRLVASMVRAWCRGSQSEGVAACPKHFPGHGAVDGDSHHELPECRKGIGEIEKVHLVPFIGAIRIPAAAIMVGHLKFHAIDPELPASLSKRAVSGLLRRQLGFGGICITDDLEMKAISDRFDLVEASIKAWQAGVDLILIGRNSFRKTDILGLIDGIVTSIRGDKGIEAILDASCRRFFRMKANFPPIPAERREDLESLLRRKESIKYSMELERRAREVSSGIHMK